MNDVNKKLGQTASFLSLSLTIAHKILFLITCLVFPEISELLRNEHKIV